MNAARPAPVTKALQERRGQKKKAANCREMHIICARTCSGRSHRLQFAPNDALEALSSDACVIRLGCAQHIYFHFHRSAARGIRSIFSLPFPPPASGHLPSGGKILLRLIIIKRSLFPAFESRPKSFRPCGGSASRQKAGTTAERNSIRHGRSALRAFDMQKSGTISEIRKRKIGNKRAKSSSVGINCARSGSARLPAVAVAVESGKKRNDEGAIFPSNHSRRRQNQ